MASATDSLPIDTAGREPEPAPCYDNFYSPENRTFYAQKPYQPLSTSHRQLRLLKLLSPSISGEHPLSFQLLDQVPLEAAQKKYTALSYCAGDPKKTVPILVNGITFNAFANLGLALQEAVAYWKRRGLDWEKYYLWADQICINQSDTDERSHQVGMMRDIYAGAARVLICLDVCESEGESKGSVGMQWASDHLFELNHFCLPRSTFLEEALRRLSEYPRDINRWTRRRAIYPLKKIDLQAFQQGIIAFLELILRPWWSRAWICQEFIFAADADFVSGGVSTPWQIFHSIFKFYYSDFSFLWDPLQRNRICSRSTIAYLETRYGGQLDTRITAASNLFKQKAGWSGPGDIKVWLEHAKSCETSDPRDRVFAFLGLASPEYNIEPDYSPSKSLDVLLIEITSKILTHDKSLDFLRFRESNRGIANGSRLPSWIPDWTIKSSDKLNPDLFNTCHRKLFSQFAPLVISRGILKLEGFKLDIFGEPQERGQYRKTRKGLRLRHNRNELRQYDSLWYFPAAGFGVLIVLRPNGGYFKFIGVADLILSYSPPYGWTCSYQLKDVAPSLFAAWSKRYWAAKMNRLMWERNHADLIKFRGVKREVVYIR